MGFFCKFPQNLLTGTFLRKEGKISSIMFTFVRNFLLAFLISAVFISPAKASAGSQSIEEKDQQKEVAREEEALPESEESLDETDFFPKAVIPQKAQIIDGIDYSNLSLKDALERMLEVNPDLNISNLLVYKALLEIKQTESEVWLPEITLAGGAVTPVDFISGEHEQEGVFAGQRVKLVFALDSDTWDRINRDEATYDMELAKFKQATAEESRKLIKTYFSLGLAQDNFKICQEALEQAKAQFEDIKKNPKYSKLDILQARHFLTRIFEKKIVAYTRLVIAQRELKILLGLQDNEDLIIRVVDLPRTIEQAEVLVEEDDLRQPQYSAEVMERNLERTSFIENISAEPVVKVTASLAGNSSQGTKDASSISRLVPSLGVDILISDFGFSASVKKAKSISSQISQLELLKEEEDLDNSEMKRNYELKDLGKRLRIIRDYISQLEEGISFLKERVELPISVLLKRNDQLVEAKCVLKEMLRDYAFTFSLMNGKDIKPLVSSDKYQELSLEDILALAEKNKVVQEEIAEKQIDLGKIGLITAEKSNSPKLYGGLSVESEYPTDGETTNSSKLYLSLEGRIFNKRLKHIKEAARARMGNINSQAKQLSNEKYINIVKNYLKAVQVKRRINILEEIVSLKNEIIDEMLEGMKKEFPRYTQVNVRPLLLEQLEANLALTRWELELAMAKFNIRKWAGIPINEDISLKDTDFFDVEDGREEFLEIIKTRILPVYHAGAAVESAASIIDEFEAKQARTTAYKGIFWRIQGEAKCDEFQGWEKPDTQVGICFSLPFWGRDKREIDEYDERIDKLMAKLNYIKINRELLELECEISTNYEVTKEMVDSLKQEKENLESQLRIVKELVRTGAKSKKDLIEAKMRLLALQLDYEDKIQAYFYASARHLLVLGRDKKSLQKDESVRFVLANLQDAVELALENSKEMKVYKDLLDTEEDVMDYYKTFYPEGSLTADYIEESTEGDPEENRDLESLVALASFDINLVKDYMKEEQNKKIRLRELDLERVKFKIILRVVGAYTDYLQSAAQWSAVNERYLKEKEKLESMKVDSKTRMITRMDYLRQEQIVNMLQQKLLAVKKESTTYKKRLAVVVGGVDSRFSVIMPDKDEDIKEKLSGEIFRLCSELIGAVTDEEADYGQLKVDIARLEKKMVDKQIESLINVGYAYLTDELKESSLFNQEELGLPLLADEDSMLLREFVSLNVSCKIYDPTKGVKSKIKAVDEDIAEVVADKNVVTVVQEVRKLLDAYEIAIINYNYAAEEIKGIEEGMRVRLEDARKRGKLSVIEEMEIIGILIKSSTDRVKAFYEMVGIRSRIDQYLKQYTGKGIDALIKFALERKQDFPETEDDSIDEVEQQAAATMSEEGC